MTWRLIATFAVGLLCAAHTRPIEAAPTKLAVGYALSADALPLFVAIDEGSFARHGLDVTPTSLTVLPVGPAGLVSSSLQITFSNPTVLLNAVSNGLDLVAIAGDSRHSKANENTSLVARTGSGIKDPQDLRGKKVGIPGFGATNDLTFRKWLKMNGVALADVTLIEARLSDMKGLLASKNLDAVAATEPVRSRITDDKTGYRVADFVTDVKDGLNGAIWITTREWANDHRVLVEAFRASLAEALDFIKTHPDEAHAIELKNMKLVSPTHPDLSLEITADDLRFFNDLMLEMGALSQPVDVSTLIFK